MPQTAALEAPTVPSPRPARSAVDPNRWVADLGRGQIALALALSDMPASRAAQKNAVGAYLPAVWPADPDAPHTPSRPAPAGVRVLNAWVAQGVDRAGGAVALWEAADLWRSLNIHRTHTTPEGKAFYARFGGRRRIDSASDLASDVPTTGRALMYLRVEATADNAPIIARLEGLYPARRTTPEIPGLNASVLFTMSEHDTRMVAAAFGRHLVADLNNAHTLF